MNDWDEEGAEIVRFKSGVFALRHKESEGKFLSIGMGGEPLWLNKGRFNERFDGFHSLRKAQACLEEYKKHCCWVLKKESAKKLEEEREDIYRNDMGEKVITREESDE